MNQRIFARLRDRLAPGGHFRFLCAFREIGKHRHINRHSISKLGKRRSTVMHFSDLKIAHVRE